MRPPPTAQLCQNLNRIAKHSAPSYAALQPFPALGFYDSLGAMSKLSGTFITLAIIASVAPVCSAQENRGYYRFPAIHAGTIVFTSEGDLWEVGTNGGVARRLTTHPGEETRAAFSPDGKTIAFSASYEGPTEV